VRRVLSDPVAVVLLLAVTLAGAVAALVAVQPVWAIVGWVVGGVAAVVVLVAVKRRRHGDR
jgi:flagellin-like protein